ncbi:hypothetical protein L1D34_29460 [Vibrio mediterranei]|uniref:hypothetical protein n=1 Tax=Vibrio mediterranei TaxID=689 RepID=UPI001EFD85C2|nr:hypothetical protein [Vibrio mediterranei]MCG9628939.1 hypothetical protein [Vibrio mediterranei]
MKSYLLIKLKELNKDNKNLSYEVLREVKVDEYTHIHELESNVSFFQAFCFAWKSIHDNLDSVKIASIKYGCNISDSTIVSRATYQNVGDICNIYTSMCNFLSSANLLISLIEKNATSKKQREIWIQRKKELHLENYSYRLCYELRNHSQHAGMPVTTVNAENLNTNDDVNIKLILEKDVILNDRNTTKNLRKYVEQASGDIDVYENMVHYVEVLGELLEYFFELNNHYYEPIVGYHEVYSKYLSSDKDETLVLVDSRSKKNDILKTCERLNLNSCKWVIDTFSKKNLCDKR